MVRCNVVDKSIRNPLFFVLEGAAKTMRAISHFSVDFVIFAFSFGGKIEFRADARASYVFPFKVQGTRFRWQNFYTDGNFTPFNSFITHERDKKRSFEGEKKAVEEVNFAK